MLEKITPTLLAWIEEASRLAAGWSKSDFWVKNKPGGLGPVTEVDQKVHDFFRDKWREAGFPGVLISEEDLDPPLITPEDEHVWFLDPIDGTKNLIKGTGQWAIMLGLLERGVPKFGIISQPVAGKTWYAQAGGQAILLQNGAKRVLPARQKVRSVPDSRIVFSSMHPDSQAVKKMKELGITQHKIYGSVGLKMVLIAEGESDVYFNFQGKCSYWDTIPGEVILNAVGGEVVTLDRQGPLRYVEGFLSEPQNFGVLDPWVALAPGMKELVL